MGLMLLKTYFVFKKIDKATETQQYIPCIIDIHMFLSAT